VAFDCMFYSVRTSGGRIGLAIEAKATAPTNAQIRTGGVVAEAGDGMD